MILGATCIVPVCDEHATVELQVPAAERRRFACEDLDDPELAARLAVTTWWPFCGEHAWQLTEGAGLRSHPLGGRV